MQDKSWYMSKTAWAGVIILLYGMLSVWIDMTPYLEVVISIAGGLGIVGLRGVLGKMVVKK